MVKEQTAEEKDKNQGKKKYSELTSQKTNFARAYPTLKWEMRWPNGNCPVPVCSKHG